MAELIPENRRTRYVIVESKTTIAVFTEDEDGNPERTMVELDRGSFLNDVQIEAIEKMGYTIYNEEEY